MLFSGCASVAVELYAKNVLSPAFDISGRKKVVEASKVIAKEMAALAGRKTVGS